MGQSGFLAFVWQAPLASIWVRNQGLMAEHDDDSVKLALLAHDLRTPLSAMRLTAELIGTGPLEVTQAEHLSVLIRSIDALTEMTGALVTAATPGAGAESPNSRVAEIVAESADLFRVAAEAKGLSFEVSIEEAARSFTTPHGGAVRRVVATLLDNAIKYTETGGIGVGLREISADEIDTTTEKAGNWIGISVSDSGPGIDAEERARLFRPFVRGRHGRETGPGTGLGLWGTAQLVEEMDGRLRLARSERGGSHFDILVPVATQTGDLKIDRGASANDSAGAATYLPARVLIVDDNDTNCRLLAALLESFGIESEVASSGAEAIDLVRNETFDAALLDLHMPGMSGVETAVELRKFRTDQELPLIAVSAASDSIGGERLRQAGFQEILTKPLAPRTLYEAMEQAGRSAGRPQE